jgi:hypothetical protein
MFISLNGLENREGHEIILPEQYIRFLFIVHMNGTPPDACGPIIREFISN